MVSDMQAIGNEIEVSVIVRNFAAILTPNDADMVEIKAYTHPM